MIVKSILQTSTILITAFFLMHGAIAHSASSTSAKDLQTPSPSVNTIQGKGLLKNFPSRQVRILTPIHGGYRQNSLESYLINQLEGSLRYPYYETKREGNLLASTPLNPEALSAASKEMGADILLIPQVEEDSYQTYHSNLFGHRWTSIFGDDDETYVRAHAVVRIFYYDAQRNMMSSSTASYYKMDESLSMPSHREVWRIVSQEALRKLPYKRIPTDINRYEDSEYHPQKVDDFLAVDQPKQTKFALSGVSIL